ncbi:Disease resistance protein [Spatholobus suberectus]|nr:Disease resistance protein [Spatholobus suberectus]
MSEFISGFFNTIASKFLDLTTGEARYLCCFKTIVEEYEKEKGKLRARRKSVQENVDEAKNRAEEIVNDVTVWMQNADNLINEDTKTKRTCFSGWCPNCIWQYHRGKELVEKMLEISELKGLNFESVGRAAKLPGVEYHSSQDFIEFESRSSQCKQLLEALKDEQNYMVGLHGMGGTGKTTLVQKVGKEVKRSNLFDEVIFTTVSHAPDIRKIQDNIATPLGLKLEEGDQLQRAKKLWSRLTNGQRILVILDDVWEELKFEDIGIPSSDNHNSCRVLLTSRKLSVCNSMSCQSTIELELLSEEDAKTLFEKHTGLRDDSSKSLKKLAQQIANECKRSPVAITAIAKSLKHQPPELWKAALKSLKEFKQIRSIDEDLKIYKCFQVSYENLKDEKAKKLFLLCSLFPEDYEIYVEDLIRYGKGLGLFGEVDSYEAARIEILTAKRKLLDACLLLKGQEGCVKMHDLVRDAAHWIANYEIQGIMGSKIHATAKQSTIMYLYLHNVKRFSLPNQLDCTKLKILIVLCLDKEASVDTPQAFFEGTKDLEVLAIARAENIRGKPSLSLPRSIEVLKILRTLCLRGFNLGDISVVQKLDILETLELSDCSINRLPNGIVKLEKLRLLSLTRCAIERNPYEVIGRLSQLEELYIMRSPDRFRWKLDKEVVASIFDKDNITPALQRYHIQIGHDSGLYLSVDDSISRGLSIEYFDPNSNATIKDLVQRAEILHLRRIQGDYTTVAPHLVEATGDMNDMIHLKLEFCSKIECLIDTSSSAVGSIFSKLVKIEVRGMDHLTELCHGPPPSDFLGNLEELSIHLCHQLHGRLFVGNLNLGRLKVFQVEYCRMLTSMFTPSTAASLVLLEELIIEGCKELKNIIAIEREDNRQEQILQHDDDNQNIYGSMFPKLKCLDIRMCDQLEFMITVCPKMNTIGATRREYLQPLSTAYCLSRQSLILRHVREMKLKNCLKTKLLFTLSVAQTMLLEELRIKECHSLKNIVTDVGDDHGCMTCGSVFPRLKLLSVSDCSQMQYMLEQDSEEQNNNIEIHIDLPDLEQLTLSNLPKLIDTCSIKYNATYPSLKEFCLDGCPEFTIKSVSDFMIRLDTRQLADKTTEYSGVIVKHLHTLEKLYIENSSIEGIICLKELPVIDQHMSSSLKSLKLYNLHELRNTFMGPKHFLSLQNVKCLKIVGCSKLKVIFSASVLRNLPRLIYLEIKDCEELQEIIEEDEENQRQSNPHSQRVCFPQLIALVINRCQRLKSLISFSTFHEFPQLELMIIKEASQLDMFRRKQGDEIAQMKLWLPKLKYLVLMQLPNLADLSQQMELQTVAYSVVHHCPKLSFASTTTLENLKNILEDSNIDRNVQWELFEILETIMEETENENPMPETISQLPMVQEVQDLQVQFTSERELPCAQIINEADKEVVAVHDSETETSSTDLEVITLSFPCPSAIHQYETPQEHMEEKVVSKQSSMDQQQAFMETNFKMEIAWETIVPSPYEHNSTKEKVERSLLEDPEAGNTIQSTNSDPRSPSPGPLFIPLQKAYSQSIKGSVLEVPTSDKAKILNSSFHSGAQNQPPAPLINSVSKTSLLSPQLFEKQSMDEQIDLEPGAIIEKKRSNGTHTADELYNIMQNVEGSTNGSVSEVVLNKTTFPISCTLPELGGSMFSPVGDLLNETSSLISPISEVNVTSSTSVFKQRMSRSLLEELFNNVNGDSFSPDTGNLDSSMIHKAELVRELKTELAVYLNVPLEAIIEANVLDNVVRIVSSLARETADAFQQNILKDFINRLKRFKESVPKAINTLQSSSEFLSNYEKLNMELNTKLNEGQEKIEDLETKLSETSAEEYSIEMEIQQLVNRKIEILDKKNFLASQLDECTQVVSTDYEKWKALGEEIKLSTDRWLKSKEDLAHANASWKIFKEILGL